MADSNPTPSNADLASRLIDHADSITNHAAHEMEQDIRAAAERLRRTDDQVPLIPKLVSELRRIALFSADLDMKNSLKSLLGELA
jgi:hypothetical protein